MNRWKRRVQALTRLAEDQAGKPEGKAARKKLKYILEKYPEAREYEPMQAAYDRVFTMKDLGEMRRMGISTDGSWTGGNIDEAVAIMIADYQSRRREGLLR